jgi:predicted metal-dependent HD superfamily phosphohydrolase
MDGVSVERFERVCRELGVAADRATYDRLVAAYGARGRHYHTVEHLAACLRELDSARSVAQFPAEVEIALWFHDAVYKTRARDNEAQSAARAATFLAAGGCAAAARERVERHIMATRHSEAKASGDTALVVNVDLSILGQPPAVYRAFEANVRREYWWVPAPVFRRERARILRQLIAGPRVYATDVFRERYEQQARCNVEGALALLERRGSDGRPPP